MANHTEGSDDNYSDVAEYSTESMPSRYLRRATDIFSVMKGEKARMLRDIGFSCLRRIEPWGILDHNFTFWLLRNLDTKTMCITTSRATVIPVTDVDVSLVMGTPKDGPYIYEEDNISAGQLDLLLKRLFVKEDQGCLTWEHLEDLLLREYTESTTEPEKDAFKIAAVMYSWAMIFSVDATFPVIPYGLFNNLSDTSIIKDLNWSALILKGVRDAALLVQGSFNSGSKKIYITGCPLFMQVFYIDNLDFGDIGSSGIYLPRIWQYSEENLLEFIKHDRDPQYSGFHEYGFTKASVNEAVVYTRNVGLICGKPVSAEQIQKNSVGGQCSSLMGQLKEALKANSHYLENNGLLKKYPHLEIWNNISEQSQAQLDVVGSSNAESSIIANATADIDGRSAAEKAIHEAFRRGSVYNVFKRFKTFSTPKSKEGPIRKNCVSTSRFCPPLVVSSSTNQELQNGSGLPNINRDITVVPEVPMEEPIDNYSAALEHQGGDENISVQNMHMDNMAMVVYDSTTYLSSFNPLDMVAYINVKWATDNSDYPQSPFDLNMSPPTVDKKKSRALYRVLESGTLNDMVWFLSNLVLGTRLTGFELAEQMKRGGEVAADVSDAVILSHAELDSQMYGTVRKHWKGYLPASFSKIVFGSNGDEYLQDDRVKEMFIGDHLQYDFEHCRKIVAPVEFDQSYSCYIWDLSAMDCHVLDPVRMNTSEKSAEDHHWWAVQSLSAAIVKCVNTFFHGWRLPEGDWSVTASTNFSQRCRRSNSAVYALHYARWYNTLKLEKDITDPELGDVRVKMLYQIISMEGNAATIRSSLISPKIGSRASGSSSRS